MKKLILILVAILVLAANCSSAGKFTIDASHAVGKVSPRLYGLMTEEINHCYDGGLYAELIHNRAFLDDTNAPAHWSAVQGEGSAATIALDSASGLNDQLTSSLRVTVTAASREHTAGVANSGYW